MKMWDYGEREKKPPKEREREKKMKIINMNGRKYPEKICVKFFSIQLLLKFFFSCLMKNEL
jgi:hypothetical protein